MANNFLPQNNPRNHNLDQQLDHALQSYLPQPRAGLEQRILARAQTVTPRRIWLQPRSAYIAASVLAACVIAAIFLAMPGRIATSHSRNVVASKILPSQPVKTAPVQPVPTNRATFATLPVTQPIMVRKSRHAPPTPSESNLPRLAVFPAPAPPTPQEEELAMFAARYPKLLVEAFKPMPSANPAPITIQPIQIKPLTIAPLSVAQLDHQQSPISHRPENAQ